MGIKDISDPDYWNDLYLGGSTGWDRGHVAPPLARMIDDEGVANGRSLVVLGAGRGHDALHAASRGLQTTAVDFAPEAAAAMREAAARGGLQLTVLQQDVFTLAKTHAGAFGAALEHTCFCAIDQSRLADYARLVHTILSPGGVFFGLFYAHGRPGGPPFTTSEAQVRELFTPLFTLERLRVAPDSFQNRSGHELEFIFRRSDDAR